MLEKRNIAFNQLQEFRETIQAHFNTDAVRQAQECIRFFNILQNWSLYKEYKYTDVKDYFYKYYNDFVVKLTEALKDDKIKNNIYAGYIRIVREIGEINKNGCYMYHTLFLDDLFALLGITVSSGYYNFLYPCYSDKECIEATKGLLGKDFEHLFELEIKSY